MGKVEKGGSPTGGEGEKDPITEDVGGSSDNPISRETGKVSVGTPKGGFVCVIIGHASTDTMRTGTRYSKRNQHRVRSRLQGGGGGQLRTSFVPPGDSSGTRRSQGEERKRDHDRGKERAKENIVSRKSGAYKGRSQNRLRNGGKENVTATFRSAFLQQASRRRSA